MDQIISYSLNLDASKSKQLRMLQLEAIDFSNSDQIYLASICGS